MPPDRTARERYPWMRHYDPGVPVELELPEEPVPWLLSQAASQAPEASALEFFGKTLNYRDFREQTLRAARALQDLGLQPGERLAALLPNCPQLAIAYHATLHLGGVAVLLNPLLSPREISQQLTDSGSRYLVVLDHLLPKAGEALKELDLKGVVVSRLTDYLPWPLNWLYPFKAWRQGLPRGWPPDPRMLPWSRLLQAPPLDGKPVPAVRDIAVLQYTGGTTGTPKAAILTHGNLMANVAQINAWMNRVQYGRERVVGLLPFFHSFGLTVCLNWAVSQAAQVIVLPRFEMEGFLKMLRRHRPTVLPGVPTLFTALINHPKLPEIDLSALWCCVSGSAPLPLEVREKFEALSGCRILEGYGLTEASPVTHFNPFEGRRPPGSIGLPFPGTVAKVVDEETGTRELPPGEVGELCLRGPQIMAGYWGKPEETAQALRDGWLYTGDLARMDEDGYFYIIDRKKDMIINGGFKIFPREVEEVLYQHPGVKEAVVYGLPDSYRGEVVKAVIVPREGFQLATSDIEEYCRPRLAAYKVPKVIEFRRELPKNMVGKVLRRKLREEDGHGEA
ncbi:MAG: long-chain fatty acid--CoA ligase [Deltaproteobacteria bacterium]|nr:long-chain fatty acid--CoA ligase [Deltaproteobacteria bacterium]